MPTNKKIKSRQINLVPQEGLASTTSGRILLWVLSTFRVLLIVTELFVIGAFLSRFWLDAKNTDLTDEMKEAKSIIVSLSDFEKDFKDIQSRLALFDEYKKSNGILGSNLQTAVSYKPPNVVFNSVSVTQTGVSIKASSVNEIEIQRYLQGLKSSGKYESVDLSEISIAKDNSDFSFAINAVLKK